MRLKKFHTIIKNTPEDLKEDIKLSMDILDRINDLLNKKFDGKQKLLAEKMDKTEAEVSKWFNGVQNFTTRTIMKLQVAFGEPIIAVCTHDEDINSTFVQAKTPYKKSRVCLIIDRKGQLEEESAKYEEVSNLKFSNEVKPDLPA